MGESSFSIIVPSMGDSSLLTCLLRSLRLTATRDYEVCIGLDPTGEWTWKPQDLGRAAGRHIVRTEAALEGGMSAALNVAFLLARGDWLIWVCDDMVFLPGWDDFSFGLRRNRALCFELMETIPGSFPPVVSAGKSPADFDEILATAEARQRGTERHQVPGRFFGSAVLHRSKWVVPWPTWCDPYSCNDISWFYEMYLFNPDLAFGRMLGNSLYHFVRASVRRAGIMAPEDTGERFLRRYGLSIQDAYSLIDARSEALW